MTTARPSTTAPPRAAPQALLRPAASAASSCAASPRSCCSSLGITFVVFVLTELVPSNAVATNLGEQAAGDPAAVAAFKHHYGLDRPFPVRYAIYLDHLVHGDLGQSSLTHGPVTHDLGQFIPATAELALYSILFAAVVGIGFGVDRGAPPQPADRPCAPRRVARRDLDADVLDRARRALRRLLPARLVPGRRAARPRHEPAAERHRASTRSTRCSPATWGLFVQALHHLVLPALVLAAFNVSLLTRFTRSAVLEVIGNDYVRAARAKGLPERTVVLRYILRGALPSVVTVLGLVFANVLTGAVLVEKIFSWPGIGQYAYQAAVNVDVPAIAGVSLFVAVVYITVNFIVDVLYGVIDPRIRVT